MELELALRLIAGQFGMDPATLIAFVAIVVTISNIVSRLIPDDAVGFPAYIRKVASVIGLYVGNRVTSGVTANDAAKIVVSGLTKDPVMNQIAEEAAVATGRTLFPQQGDTVPTRVFEDRPDDLKSHWMIPIVLLIVILLSGCAMTIPSTVQGATQAVCANRQKIEQTAERVIRTAEAAIRVVQACPIIR